MYISTVQVEYNIGEKLVINQTPLPLSSSPTHSAVHTPEDLGHTFSCRLEEERLLKRKWILSWSSSVGMDFSKERSAATNRVSMLVVLMDGGWRKSKTIQLLLTEKDQHKTYVERPILTSFSLYRLFHVMNPLEHLRP